MSDDNEPCRVCGAAVRLELRAAERRLGQEKPDMYELRVCTSAVCNTNAGRNRRLGATP